MRVNLRKLYKIESGLKSLVLFLESLGRKIKKVTVTDPQQKDEDKTPHKIEISYNTHLKEITGLNACEINSMHYQEAEEAAAGYCSTA